MKTFWNKFGIILLLFYTSMFAQNYIDADGTSAPKWRIGNDRYIELYSDDDSNFVQVNINGYETRLATQNWILQKTRADSVFHAYNLMGGAANKIPYQVSTDSTGFINAPTTNKTFLRYNNGYSWAWAWGPDTTTVVRTTRLITTTAPIRIDGGSSANLSADRTVSLLYNSTHFSISSNQLTANNVTVSSSNGVTGTTFTLGGSTIINTPQDIRTTASPTFYDLTTTNNLSVGAYVNSNLIPNYTDTYDLGSSTKLWRKGWLSEMEAILFAKNTITLLGGWFYVTKNAGTLPYDVTTSQTQIDFGTTLTANDFIVFRNPGVVEYMQITSLVSGTTYNVTRNKDGSGANAFVAGTPFAVLGYNGDGRIEFNAYDTPRISILKQGTTYNSQTELIRIGDINGMPGYSSQTFGAYFGDASTYFKYDATNGAVIRGALYLTNGDNVSTVLSSKASQTDLNTLSGTVSTHTTQIAQNTSDISLKASQTDLNTLTGRVTSAESAITVNANAIILKANKTGLDSVKNRMTTAEASITVNANAITSEVTNRSNADGTLQSQITQNANNINLKVSKNDVINQINISTESIDISGAKIAINGSTTFASGYDPSTKIASGGAAADVNNNTTNITGNKVRTGIIQSNNYSSNAGSYFDLDNGTIALGGSSAPAFSVSSTGYMTSTSALLANWYIRNGIITDNATSGSEMVVLNQTQKSIYIRPITGLVKYVMVGQTNNGGSPGWTGNYGISAIDNSNNYLFRLDDAVTSIAGINFDYQRLYSISSSTGFEISKASSKNVTTGFAVWNISSSPKMFIGNSTSSMDWNSTTSNTLTIKGTVKSSTFSTTTDETHTLDHSGVYISSNEITSSYYAGSTIVTYDRRQTVINPGEITLYKTYGTDIVISYAHLGNSSTDFIQLSGYNVPKFRGVTSSPGTTNLRAGDMYLGTNNVAWIYNGSSWIQLN